MECLLKRDPPQARGEGDVDSGCGEHGFTGYALNGKSLRHLFPALRRGRSNLDEDNTIDVTLGNWEVVTPKQSFKPKTLTLHARTDIDTTRVSFHAGDLGIILTGNDCIHHITDKLTKVSNDITLQLERDSTVNLEILRPLLPICTLRYGQDRTIPIYNYLQT